MDSMTLAAKKQKYYDKIWIELCSRISEMEKSKMYVSEPKENVKIIKDFKKNGQRIVIRRKLNND